MFKKNRVKITIAMIFFYTVSIFLSNMSIVFAEEMKNENLKKINKIVSENQITEKEETKSKKTNNKKPNEQKLKIENDGTKDNRYTTKELEKSKLDKKSNVLSKVEDKKENEKNNIEDKLNNKSKNIKEKIDKFWREVSNETNNIKEKKRTESMERENKRKTMLWDLGLSYNKTKNSIVSAMSLSMNEESRTLEEDETLDSLELKGGTIDLNGHILEIKGDLKQIDGIINVNKGKLIIHGNYNIEGTGVLNSIEEEDYIRVDGKLTVSSKNVSILDKGTLELKGDFLFNSSNLDSFQCGERQKTLISGNVIQNIKFENYDYNQKSAFGIVNINNKQGIVLQSTLKAHYFEDFDKVNGNVDVCFVKIKEIILSRNQTINGNLTLRNVNLTFKGIRSQEGTEISYEMKIKGDFNFCFDGCNLKVDKGRLIVEKNLNGKSYSEYNGKLILNSLGYIEVRGDINGSNESNNEKIDYEFEGGVIECRGDVILNERKKDGWLRDKLILNGNKVQKIRMRNIGTLIIQDGSQAQLLNHISIDNPFQDFDKITGESSITISGTTILTRDYIIKDKMQIETFYGSVIFNGHTMIFEKDFLSSCNIGLDQGALIVKGNLVVFWTHNIRDPDLSGYVSIGGDYIDRATHSGSPRHFIEIKGDIYIDTYRSHSLAEANIALTGNKKQKIVKKEKYIFRINSLIIDRPEEEAFEFIDETNTQGDNPFYRELIMVGKVHETQGKVEYCNGDGVNDSTGNFMETYKDLSVKLGNLDFEFTRSYNSQNNAKGVLGKGWSFGYEGSIINLTESGKDKQVNLPDGGIIIFSKNELGDYFAHNSRDKLNENNDGTFILTKPSLEKYGFNKKGYLQYIEDRNGNRVNINTNDTDGKINKIKDLVGREFILTYNNQGFLTSIKDPLNREVKYEYSNDKLIKVTNASNNILKYSYDSSGNLSDIKNADGTIIKKIIYKQDKLERNYKVHQTTDEFGNTFTYNYNIINRTTEIIDKNNRKTTKEYDKNRYLIKEIYPDGYRESTNYEKDEKGQNKYGDIKFNWTRDRLGTEYKRDANGNITEIINDRSYRSYVYDSNNNLILEVDESGKKTHYIYDDKKINLSKKVQAFEEKDNYIGVDDRNKFAITEYVYYTDKEIEELGCSYKGLLKKVIDPNGNSKTFLYDKYANVAGEIDEEGNKTTKEYNSLGWKTKEISPSGNITQYFYNKNGDIEKSINPDGEVERSYFDNMGRKIAEVNPEQYKAEFDKGESYTGAGANELEYYSNGKVKLSKDAEGNTTQFFYDIYGNKVKEVNPKGGINLYEYDVANRVTKIKFKESEEKPEILLEDYEYGEIFNRKIVKNKKYSNDKEYTLIEKHYDYADKVTNTIYNNDITEETEYYPNGQVKSKKDKNKNVTYYVYDGLNRVKEEWTPISLENEEIKYSCTKYEYDKVGNKIKELRSKDKLKLYENTQNYICKNQDYYKNNKLKSIWYSDGRREEFTYDKDGFANNNTVYTSENKKITKQSTNNFRGNPVEEKSFMLSEDFYEENTSNSSSGVLQTASNITLSTTNIYDKNGNIIKKKTPSGHEINYNYDSLNRETKKWEYGENEFDEKTVVANEITYNWNNEELTKKDALGNISTNEYNSKGLLEKSIDSNNGVTYKNYDHKGRIKFEVTSENYYSNKAINEMNRTEFIYDNMDNLIAIKQYYKINNDWKEYVSKAFMYDSIGNKIKELNADEYEKASGDTIEEKIKNGNGTDYVYNLHNELISMVTPEAKSRKLNETMKYEYDALGRKIKEINSANTETKYYYDDADNIIKISAKDGKDAEEKVIKTTTYDLIGNKLTETDGNKNVTTYTYNDINKVKSITFSGDSTSPKNIKNMKYDREGNLSYETDTSKREIIYSYDKQSNITSVSKKYNNENIVSGTKYDLNGNKRFEIDGEGNAVENNYDKLNRIISKKTKVRDINNKTKDHTTKYEYDKNNNLIKEIDWLGNEKINEYDAINRIVKKIDGNGKIIELLEYNKDNLQTKSTNALGNIKEFSYNKDGKLIKTIDEEGNSIDQNYDDKGNLSSKSDGNGNVTTYRYDEFNRLIGVTNPLGEETHYTYDLNGNRLTQKDGNGNITTYKYNVANKVSKIIYPNGGNGETEVKGKVENYKYDYDGNVTEKVDRNGNITKYIYDFNGNLLSEVVTKSNNPSDKVETTYTYDKNKNQLSMTDATGTTARQYDELGRVISKTIPNVGAITFNYDITEGLQPGEVAEESVDPKGIKTVKVTDKVGRLKKVINNSKVTEYTYNDNGTRKSLKYPGGTTEEYSYYKNNLLKGLKNIKPDGTIIDTYSYEYDKSGNQTKKQDIKGITEYKYDPLSRLSEVKENTELAKNRVTTYNYDKAGNRTLEIVDGVKNIYKYNEDNRLLNIEKILGDTKEEEKNYKYDYNGNQLEVQTINYNKDTKNSEKSSTEKNVVENSFDLLNRLVATKSSNNENVKNIYNGEGKRVGKEVNGNLTTYVYEGEKVILELDKEGKVKARNTQGVNLISREIEDTTAYYLYNGHVDITSLVDESGKELASYYYDAFGNTLEEKGDIDNPYRYSEYQYDKETETYYCMSRMYDPEIARFLSEDTYRGDIKDPLSLNVYAYVNNNPVTYTDPDGHLGLVAIFGAAVVGGIIGGLVGVGIKALTKRITTGSAKLSFKEAAGAFAGGAVAGVLTGVTGGAASALSSTVTGGATSVAASTTGGAALKEVLSTAVKFTGIGIGAIFGDAAEQKINTDRVNWVSASKTGAFAVGFAYGGGKAAKALSKTALGQKVGSTISKFKTKSAEAGRKALESGKTLARQSKRLYEASRNAISKSMNGGNNNLAFEFAGNAGIADDISNNSKSFKDYFKFIKNNLGDGVEGVADPKDIHFMQSSIKNQTGSHTVLENAEALKNGTLKASDLPNIKVWKDDAGKMWTLDHRRLGAFKQAGLNEIPIQWATPEEVASQMWKMTTKNGGTSIKLKLGNGESMIIK